MENNDIDNTNNGKWTDSSTRRYSSKKIPLPPPRQSRSSTPSRNTRKLDNNIKPIPSIITTNNSSILDSSTHIDDTNRGKINLETQSTTSTLISQHQNGQSPFRSSSLLDRIISDLESLSTNDQPTSASPSFEVHSSSSYSPSSLTMKQLQREIQTLKDEKESMRSIFESEKIRLLTQMQDLMHQLEISQHSSTSNKDSSSVASSTTTEALEQMERRNTELRHQIDILASECESSEKSNSNLRKQLGTVRDLEDQLEMVKKEKEKYMQMYGDRQDALNGLADELRGFRLQINQLQIENQEIRAELEIKQDIEGKFDVKCRELNEIKDDMETLRAENERLQREADEKVSSSALEYRLELNKVRQELEEVRQSERSLREQLEPLEEENLRLRDALSQMETEKQTILRQVKDEQGLYTLESPFEPYNLTLDVRYLEDRLVEMDASNVKLSSELQSLRLTNDSLNDQVIDKDRVILRIKNQYSKRIDAAETELKECNLALMKTEDEKNQLSDQLVEMEKHIKRVDPRLEYNERVVEGESIAELKERIHVLVAERDSLLQAQQAMVQRQIEEVREREEMQDEMEMLRLEMQEKIDMLENENSSDNSKSGEKSAKESKELVKYRKQIQKMVVEHDASEKEFSERISHLQIRLNETLNSLEKVSREKDRLEKEGKFEKESLELKLKQIIEEKDKQISAKERELMSLQNSTRVFKDFRKLIRERSQTSGLSDIPEEGTGVSEDIEKLATQPIPKTRQLKNPELLHSDKATFQKGSSIKDLSNDPVMIGNPLETEIDMSRFQVPRDSILPMDPRQLHDDIYKLLANIQQFRNMILEKQVEIDKLRTENVQMSDDIQHIEGILSTDRQRFEEVLSEWHDYAAAKEAEHSLILHEREETQSKLKAELELAKEEWSRIVLQKEEIILHLIENERDLVRDFYEESAMRLNKMQKVMETHLKSADEMEGTMMLINLSKYRRENLAAEFFGDLASEVQKRFGRYRRAKDDFEVGVLPSLEDISNDNYEGNVDTFKSSSVSLATTTSISKASNSIAKKKRRRWSLW